LGRRRFRAFGCRRRLIGLGWRRLRRVLGLLRRMWRAGRWRRGRRFCRRLGLCRAGRGSGLRLRRARRLWPGTHVRALRHLVAVRLALFDLARQVLRKQAIRACRGGAAGRRRGAGGRDVRNQRSLHGCAVN
jgi:hypothetical protein